MAHSCNLTFKIMSSLGIVNNIKDLSQSCHVYFAHSLKMHLVFTKLIDLMETKGLKMLKNMKTQWISLLDLLWNFFSKYKPLLTKTFLDNSSNQTTKVPFFTLI